MSLTETQLSELERLCSVVYGNVDPSSRVDAEHQLAALRSNVEFVPQCMFILSHSKSNYAQMLAAQSLESLVTKYWASFTNERRIDMRNSLFDYVVNQSLDKFVLLALTKCCCRITKLGWFDSVEQREIIGKVQRLMGGEAAGTTSTSPPEYRMLVGLRIFMTLVEEMNTPTPGKTATVHRKTAVSFRDQGLLQAFTVSIEVLQSISLGQLSNNSNIMNLINLALHLSLTCLTFDFIGTNPEDSQEDVGTVQVPTSWRAIIQDVSTLQLFFTFYDQCQEPQDSSNAIKCLIQLSSVRRSLFSGEKERSDFLNCLMDGIYKIMSTKHRLEEEENYHEFCRLLGRLKASYQLSEMVKVPHFTQWLQKAGEFTLLSFQGWQNSMNSIHYLLALWGRMVAALPYLRTEAEEAQASNLRDGVLLVTNAFIQTMVIDSTTAVVSNGAEDPLEDEGSLREAMDRLPVLARLHYSSVAAGLCALWDENFQAFQIASSQGCGSNELVELRLTWLVCITASIITGTSSIDARKGTGNEDLLIDAKLSSYCFLLCDAINKQLQSSNGASKVDVKLEKALLEFFKSFKKMYLLDSMSGGGPQSTLVGSPVSSHPLLSLALSYSQRTPSAASGMGSEDKELTDGKEVTDIFEALRPQLGGGEIDCTAIMNLLVDKICNNIKYWHSDEDILKETLDVFVELVGSYGSSKTLLQLDTVKFLIHNHDGSNFAFLGYDNDNKHRVTFYSALARLVFSSSEDLDNLFDSFMAPNLQIISQLSTVDVREPSARIACIGLLRDLRGMAMSSYNKRTYTLLFEALFPSAFPLLLSIAENLSDDPIVMTALFKFMQEFVQNRSQRIVFEQSSANGILLFRETSKIICAYGSRILQTPPKSDVYKEKYKGIRLMLNTLTCSLCGGYVNFGVFSLYNDACLQNSLDVALQILLQIPIEDVMTYMKLSKAYYGVLEIFFRQHLDVLSGLSAPIFLQLVKANHEGLQSNELTVMTQCASAIDHLATYIFLNQARQKPTVQRIMSHLETEPECFLQLLVTLFNSLLFNSTSNYWPLTRPILSIILISESCYAEFQSQLLSTQSMENQTKLTAEFTRLTDNLQRSLDVSNRDKFTTRVTMFRTAVRSFMNL